MNTLFNLTRSAFLALLLVGALAACDTTGAMQQDDTASSEQEIELLATSLAADLSLSSSQQAALGSTMDRLGKDGVRDPGFLWRLAAEMSATLTDEQKQKLFDRAAQGPGGQDGQAGRGLPGQGRPGGAQDGRMGPGGDRGMGPGGEGDAERGNFLSQILTEAQLTDLQAIREARRADVEAAMLALREARASGDEAALQAARDALKAIHEEVRAEVDAYLAANLTQDQLDAIEAARAEMEERRAAAQAEEQAVMAEVLQIGDAEVEAILAAQDAFRAAIEAIDRAGDVQAQFSAAFGDLHTAVAAVLTDATAFEIWQIHQALAARAHAQRGGPGGGRPMGGGPGR